MARRSIRGCRVLVTGASGGIGRALALDLVAQGAQVVALARRAERLAQLVTDAAKSAPISPGAATAPHGAIEPVAGDVTLSADRRRALDAACQRWGGLDVLVNNAGVGALGPFEHADEARLRHLMEVNFFAPAELIRESLPILRQGVAPLIVNVSSVLGHCAVPRMSEYCASKFALQGLSDSLRAELAGQGIDLLVVSPGTTQSEFFENLVERRSEALLPGRPRTTAEAVARATVRAMARGRREIIPSHTGRLLCWLHRLSPGLVDRVLARMA